MVIGVAAFRAAAVSGAMVGGAAALGFRYRRAAFGPEVLLFSGSPGVSVVDGLARIDLVVRVGKATMAYAFGLAGNLPEVTGASKAVCLGSWVFP